MIKQLSKIKNNQNWSIMMKNDKKWYTNVKENVQ